MQCNIALQHCQAIPLPLRPPLVEEIKNSAGPEPRPAVPHIPSPSVSSIFLLKLGVLSHAEPELSTANR